CFTNACWRVAPQLKPPSWPSQPVHKGETISAVQAQVEASSLPSKNWSDSRQVSCKRALDVVVSAFLLVLLSPLFLILAVLVKLSSPGPALYQWKVVGENGEPFSSRKFRS